jgi:membrane protease YdiL (CAAX protease family)
MCGHPCDVGLRLAFGIPAASALILRLVTVTVPAATTGSVGERFLLRISGGVIVEWAFVAATWLTLRKRRSSFADLGVESRYMVRLDCGVDILRVVRRKQPALLPTMGVPISSAFMPQGFHLYAALILGITAGFCEELLFRAFLMTEFRNGGFSGAIQIIIPGIAFGLAHSGYSNLGVVAVIGIMVPTAVLGMIWGIAYRLDAAASCR